MFMPLKIPQHSIKKYNQLSGQAIRTQNQGKHFNDYLHIQIYSLAVTLNKHP